MSDPLVGVLLAAALAALGTGLASALARRVGLVDTPGEGRIHRSPTPRLGGVGLLVGLLPALLATEARGAAVVATAYFLVGLADDLRPGGRGIPALGKLAMQVAVAVAAVLFLDLRWAGRASDPWGAIDLGPASAVMTVVWLVAVVNLVNFTDGIDGISVATGVVFLGTAAGVGGTGADLALAGVGALLGFGLWNAPPARAFLGDGGSHLLGGLVASMPCAGLGVESSAAVPWALACAPLVPTVVDVAMALGRKTRLGIPLARAHDDHLYQRLVKAGTPTGIVAVRYGVLAWLAALLAGVVAQSVGALAVICFGVAALGLHLFDGVRRTAGVPRSLRP